MKTADVKKCHAEGTPVAYANYIPRTGLPFTVFKAEIVAVGQTRKVRTGGSYSTHDVHDGVKLLLVARGTTEVVAPRNIWGTWEAYEQARQVEIEEYRRIELNRQALKDGLVVLQARAEAFGVKVFYSSVGIGLSRADFAKMLDLLEDDDA